MSSTAGDEEKIELHAIYRKSGKLEIRDQHGRQIDGIPDTEAFGIEAQTRTIVGVTLEAPRWPTEKPHAEIRIRVPLEVEERLSDWMREFLEGYGG